MRRHPSPDTPCASPSLFQELLDLHRRYVHCAADDACSYGGRAAVRCAVDEALAAALMLAGRMASAVSAAGGDEGWAQVWTHPWERGPAACSGRAGWRAWAHL